MYFFINFDIYLSIIRTHTHFLPLPRSIVCPHQLHKHTVLKVLLFKFVHDLRETEREASCHSKNKQQVISNHNKKRGEKEDALHRWRVHPPWDE